MGHKPKNKRADTADSHDDRPAAVIGGQPAHISIMKVKPGQAKVTMMTGSSTVYGTFLIADLQRLLEKASR